MTKLLYGTYMIVPKAMETKLKADYEAVQKQLAGAPQTHFDSELMADIETLLSDVREILELVDTL